MPLLRILSQQKSANRAFVENFISVFIISSELIFIDWYLNAPDILLIENSEAYISIKEKSSLF